MTERDAAAKRDFIASYFGHFAQRVEFLAELDAGGHQDEALILCLVYIEGLGNQVYPDDQHSMRNFVRIIREHGGEEVLTLIHPGHLLRALPQKSPPIAKTTVDAITPPLSARPTDLLDEDELMAVVGPSLSGEQAAWLRDQLWRGTLSGVVYSHMRSVAVKQGLVSQLFLSRSTRHGEPVPPLDLDMLLPVLRRIAATVRKLSMDTGRWFGNDAVLKDDGK